jgi:hypothetical protein
MNSRIWAVPDEDRQHEGIRGGRAIVDDCGFIKNRQRTSVYQALEIADITS